MTQNPQYTPYHPKWYRTRMPIFWWVHKWKHLRFIMRELTSVPVACYALVLLWHVRAVAQGPEAYAAFLARLKTPVSIGLHAIALVCVLFHSLTWFYLAQKALVVRVGGTPIPGVVIVALNFVAWGLCSAVIAWLLVAI